LPQEGIIALMPEVYVYTLASVFIVSMVSLIGLFTLSLKEDVLRKYIFLLVSLAIGALLGDAFIHLIPESFESLDATLVGLLIIVGILAFFILEKFLHWHHSHGLEDEGCADQYREHEEAQGEGGGIRPLGHLVIVSDGVHNFLDGVIIAASYFVSAEVGIATTAAVMLHEIPQEIGDFGVLLHAGFTRMRALFVNFLSALSAVLGALAVLFLNETLETAILWLVPLAAGGFIYIASSDLIPELHKTEHAGESLLQLAAIAIGVVAMALLVLAEV